jgi:hypothetical protein
VKRKLLNLATTISLAFALATIVLWCRSYFACDVISGQKPGSFGLDFCFPRGTFQMMILTSSAAEGPSWSLESALPRTMSLAYLSRNGNVVFDVMGFAVARAGYGSGSITWVLIPFWSLVLAFGVLPGSWLLLKRREHRRRSNMECVRCGYDLRATPDRCPECGTPVEAAQVCG